MVLSLWLVMPTAAKSVVSRRAVVSAADMHISTLRYTEKVPQMELEREEGA